MKFLVAAVCLLTSAVLADALAAPIEVETTRRSLNAEQPEQDRVGALLFRGALDMTADNEHFGGLSGLEVSADGSRLNAVGDRGSWFTARLLYDDEGWLSGLDSAELAPMLGLNGKPLQRKNVQDAEAVTALPDGSLLVSFEHKHRLRRYGNGRAEARQAESWPSPTDLENLPYNDGLETLSVLGDGRLLAIAQDDSQGDAYPAFLWNGTDWDVLSYGREGIYQPSGAALLPGGDLLVLERRFSWIGGLGSRLMRIPAASIEPGALLKGTELAVLGPPLINENWEGLATAVGPRGETLIYLLSDDNFMPLLRNMLVMFELAP